MEVLSYKKVALSAISNLNCCVWAALPFVNHIKTEKKKSSLFFISIEVPPASYLILMTRQSEGLQRNALLFFLKNFNNVLNIQIVLSFASFSIAQSEFLRIDFICTHFYQIGNILL